MSQGSRRPLAAALAVAEPLLALLSPACERVVLAGSLRRRVAEVGDVEVVAIPRPVEVEASTGQAGLFGPPVETRSAAWEVLDGLVREGKAEPFRVVDGTRVQDARWHEKRLAGVAKMLRLWLPAPAVGVDVFLATVETWGAVFAIRTGSAEYSQAVVSLAKRDGYVRVHEARVRPVIREYQAGEDAVMTDDKTWLGSPLETPEEADFFLACGVAWRQPDERRTAADVRELRR